MWRGRHRRGTVPEFRPDIEGLRAVAILLVVLYHAGVPAVAGGYVGVDVFFVISGFLITSQLFDELARTGRISIRRFYARRAARLLPAATLAVVVTVLASRWWLAPTRFKDIAYDAVAASGYVINYRLAIQHTDYLAAAQAPSPLQHFWSLAVEEQFYLGWPLLLLAAALLIRRRGRGPSRAGAVAALACVTLASFAIGVWQTGAAAPWAYFGAPARIWELGIGALLALGRPALARMPRALGAMIAWAGTGAIVFAAMRFSDATPFPGYAAALPVLGAASVVAGGSVRTAAGVAPVLGLGPFRLLGRLSYSWYLWHWPVLIIVPAALHMPASVGLGLVLGAVSLGLAALTYVLVENPVRARRAWRARPWRGIALGASLSTGAAAVALVAAYLVPAPVGTGTAVDTQALLAAPPATPAPSASAAPAGPGNDLASLIASAVDTRDVPVNLSPALHSVASDLPVIYQDGCHAAIATATVKAPCAYGDRRSGTTVVLFGDSHAAQWFGALNALALARHWRLVVVTKSGCSAASSLIYLAQLKRGYTECVRWRTAALEHIRQLRPALVVMSAIETTGALIGGAADTDQAWTDGWVTTIRGLKAPGTRLVLVSDTPWPHTNVPDCVSAHLHDVVSCTTPLAQALPSPRQRDMVAAAAVREGVQVVDPLPWLCTQQTCPVIVGNLLVYRDDSHLSTPYSALLAPFIGAQLAPP